MKVTGPRSLAIDPRTGNVYWNNFDDTIVCYDYARDTIETINEPNFNRPILIISIPEQYRTNWRSIRWNDMMQKFYGVMYQSEYLFSMEESFTWLPIIFHTDSILITARLNLKMDVNQVIVKVLLSVTMINCMQSAQFLLPTLRVKKVKNL